MLLNNLYTLQEKGETENGLTAIIQVNPNHFVYKSHFPENPVTPGVYLLQIATEILSTHLNTKLTMEMVKNVKFLQILKPVLNESTIYEMSWKEIDDKFVSSIIVKNEFVVFAKINASFRCVE